MNPKEELYEAITAKLQSSLKDLQTYKIMNQSAVNSVSIQTINKLKAENKQNIEQKELKMRNLENSYEKILNQNITQMEKARKTFEEKLNQKQDFIKNLQKNYLHLQQAYQELEQQNFKLKNERNSVKNEFSSLRQLQACFEQIQEKNQSISYLKKHISDDKKLIDNLIKANEEKDSEIEKMRKQFKGMVQNIESRKKEEKGKCIICYEKSANFAYIGCGHLCICDSCDNQLKRLNKKSCPLCKKVSERRKIFPNILEQ